MQRATNNKQEKVMYIKKFKKRGMDLKFLGRLFVYIFCLHLHTLINIRLQLLYFFVSPLRELMLLWFNCLNHQDAL